MVLGKKIIPEKILGEFGLPGKKFLCFCLRYPLGGL